MFIYLHGFNSSGASAKGKCFANRFPEYTVLRPSYPAEPGAAITYLSDYIKRHNQADRKTLLIGSSLGGFYAQYLARQLNTAVVMINPALSPAETLPPYFGMQTNFYTGEQYFFGEAQLKSLLKYSIAAPCKSPVPTLLLLDKGDEAIDYHHALETYHHCAVCHCFEDGDHQFQHLDEAVALIRQFYLQEC